MENEVTYSPDRIKASFSVDPKGNAKLDITVETYDGNADRVGPLLSKVIAETENALTEQNYQIVKNKIK